MGVHEVPVRQGGAVFLSVKVHPSARADGVRAWDPATRSLEVSIAAPPVDGRANDALLRFLADVLGVRRTDVRLRSGEGARHKRVEIPDDAPLARLDTAPPR